MLLEEARNHQGMTWTRMVRTIVNRKGKTMIIQSDGHFFALHLGDAVKIW